MLTPEEVARARDILLMEGWVPPAQPNDGLRSALNEVTIGAAAALAIAQVGQYDGAHHKTWVIDQMVRALTGEGYEEWVAEFEAGEDGPKTYEWETGIAP